MTTLYFLISILHPFTNYRCIYKYMHPCQTDLENLYKCVCNYCNHKGYIKNLIRLNKASSDQIMFIYLFACQCSIAKYVDGSWWDGSAIIGLWEEQLIWFGADPILMSVLPCQRFALPWVLFTSSYLYIYIQNCIYKQ